MLRCVVVAAICCAVLLLPAVCKGDGKMPEIRAIWVARWDIASPEACRSLVKLSRENNLNAIFVQVRGRGDALYKSSYEPRSELLSEQDPNFDPLGMILDAGHEAGLQIHAWINANYTWAASESPVSPEHIVNKHPDWLMRTNDNVVSMTGGSDVEGAYTCPSNELFRVFLKDIYLDVINKYDVDGVHFDFIRYPSTRFCYCDRCLGKFKAEMDGRISPEEKLALSNSPDRKAYTFAFPAAWDDFRRSQISRMVYTIYDAVKAVKPSVLVSASVFPNYNDAYNHRFQDWKQWMADGKIDMLCPMAYATDTETFARDVKDAVESAKGVPVCAGIGAWRIDVESTAEKIRKARELGTAGFSMFSWAVTKEGTDGTYLKTLMNKLYPDAVSLPLAGLEK